MANKKVNANKRNKTASNKKNVNLNKEKANIKNEKANIKNEKANVKNEKANVKNKKEEVKTTIKIKEDKKIKQPKVKGSMLKSDNELIKLIKIVLVVTLIMVVFYGITLLVTKNKSSSSSSNDSSSEKAVIQYDDIIIGTMLNKSQDRYYVLIKEEDDNRITEYKTLMTIIEAKENSPKIYTANLTDSFNKKYLAKEANDSNDMEEFRVTGTTLVEIEDGKIKNIYSDYDEIKEELDALAS
jgi:hypothetical protein